MKNTHIVFAGWSIIFLILLAAGCTNIPQENVAQELVSINTIGILPAHPARTTILPSETKTTEQLEAGSGIINSLLGDYFKGYNDVRFISQTELEGLSSKHSGKPLYLAREAGQQLNYDAILVTGVERYQTRTGSAYAVVDPASVAFSLKLLAIKSGRVIWSADFDQTQQPLFQNILSSRSTGSGFRWLTAAELAKAGLTKKLDNCPYLKINP